MSHEDWTGEEVSAAVDAYVEMFINQRAGVPFSKAKVNENLRKGALSKRSKGSIEYRMQNISAVFDDMKMPWLIGYKPARNIGPKVKAQIKRLLAKFQIPPITNPKEDLETTTIKLREKMKSNGPWLPPIGNDKVPQAITQAKIFLRNAQVKAWILNNAKGVCESCKSEAPFTTDSGLPYLETHHVLTLAEGGSDTIENTVALCPNCHRRIHYGQDRSILKKVLIAKVKRLSISGK